MGWSSTASRDDLVARLTSYWKLELANIVLLPVGVLFVAVTFGARPGLLTVLSIPANLVLLALGGLYWRAKLHAITGRPETLRNLLPILHRGQLASALLTVVAVAAAVAGWVVPHWSNGFGDRVLATIFATLAAAEYVNYYHRQLQHFDHVPDLRRLLAGRGFRRSKLAVDLDRWRRASKTGSRRPGEVGDGRRTAAIAVACRGSWR